MNAYARDACVSVCLRWSRWYISVSSSSSSLLARSYYADYTTLRACDATGVGSEGRQAWVSRAPPWRIAQ